MLSGILPILLIVWAANTVVPVVSQPAFVETMQQVWAQAVRLIGVVSGALFKGLGELIVQQPAIVGWLLVLAGMVFVWNGVYRQLLSQPTAVSSARGNS